MKYRNALLLASFGVFAVACNEYQINKQTDVQGDLDEDGEPDIAVDPGSINFGNVIAYDEAAAPPDEEVAVITVTNEGTVDLHIEDVLLDDATGPFSLGSLSAALIQPGGSAQISVTFHPREPGELSNTVFFLSDDPDEGRVAVPIIGVGVAPAIQITPTEYDFGMLYIGCEGEQVFEISNVGTAPLEVSSVGWTTGGGSDLSYAVLDSSLPATLNPGDRPIQVVVTSAPTDEVPDVAYIDVASNDPIRPSVRASIDATGELFGSNTDLYEQPLQGRTDIIFAVDKSCSMNDDIANVQSNFGSFVTTLAGMDADFHVAATVNDNGCIVGSEKFIDDSFSPSQSVATITTMIDLGGSYASNTERAFMLFESFLAESTRSGGGCNPGTIREDAKLALIGVSDEVEQSVNSYTYYVSLFQSLKDNPDDVIFHAIGGDYPSGCASAEPYRGFYEATVATGGLFLSLCATDWGAHLEALAEGSAANLTSFALTDYPVPSTIAVRVDGVTTTTGWSYDAGTNAIEFDFDYVPEGGSTVEISYALYGDCDG